VADDDAAARARLEALEREVRAEVAVDRARKEAALQKVREQRAKQQAERDELRRRQAALVARKSRPQTDDVEADDDPGDDDDDRTDGMSKALQLAGKAQGVGKELSKPRKTGDKSWKTSGLLSLFFGPVGWLYAGSFREAIPAAAAWVAIGAIFSKLFALVSFFLLPVLAVLLPLSGITGVVYALRYNSTGKRQRLFGSKDDKKKLTAGSRP
jgi:hypothetical protein